MSSVLVYQLFLCLFSAIFSYGIALETVSANASVSCSSDETQCAFGCCPISNAVCCLDGFECCPPGKICLPWPLGLCVGLENDNGEASLVSSKSTALKNLITACPPGTTTCGPDKCCRFPHATCCSDGEHCCPEGYRCDLRKLTCIKESLNDLSAGMSFLSVLGEVPQSKVIHKPAFKSCPGNSRICPSYTSCCISDNGEWGCCPNPSLPQLSYGQGECCNTIWGHVCCPDVLPHCSQTGCLQ